MEKNFSSLLWIKGDGEPPGSNSSQRARIIRIKEGERGRGEGRRVEGAWLNQETYSTELGYLLRELRSKLIGNALTSRRPSWEPAPDLCLPLPKTPTSSSVGLYTWDWDVFSPEMATLEVGQPGRGYPDHSLLGRRPHCPAAMVNHLPLGRGGWP